MLNGLRDKISVDADKKVNAERLDSTSLDLGLLSVNVCVFHSSFIKGRVIILLKLC